MVVGVPANALTTLDVTAGFGLAFNQNDTDNPLGPIKTLFKFIYSNTIVIIYQLLRNTVSSSNTVIIILKVL